MLDAFYQIGFMLPTKSVCVQLQEFVMFPLWLLLFPHSHAVLAAEVVHHFLPKLVELHNYSPANSISQKLENWRTLNSECDVCRW